MSNNDEGAAIAAFLWIGTIVLSIGSGIMAWNWIEPETFRGAVGFLFVWAILSKIAHFIMFGILFTMLDH